MRQARNIFDGKSTRVIRCLLVNFGKEWVIRSIAEETQVALGYTHAVVATLIKLGYVARNENNKLVVTNPTRLLKRWAAYHQYDVMNRFLDYYTFERDLQKQLDQLRKIRKPDYSLTSLVGAWLKKPYVRPTDIHLYVKSETDAKKMAEALGLNPTPEAGNVKMVIPYDEGAFYGSQEIDGVKVVSNVQLYVDLYNYPARGEEAAGKIFEAISKEWAKQETAVNV